MLDQDEILDTKLSDGFNSVDSLNNFGIDKMDENKIELSSQYIAKKFTEIKLKQKLSKIDPTSKEWKDFRQLLYNTNDKLEEIEYKKYLASRNSLNNKLSEDSCYHFKSEPYKNDLLGSLTTKDALAPFFAGMGKKESSIQETATHIKQARDGAV